MKKPMNHRKLMYRLATVSGLALGMSLQTGPAMAADPTISFNIKKQTLAEALADFSRQSDIIVFAPQAVTQKKLSHRVSGAMSPTEALRQLLSGSTLSFSRNDNGVYTIIPRSGFQKIGLPSEEDYLKNLGIYEGDLKKMEEIQNFTFDEIVVTASKRSTSLQSTAMALSVVTGEVLEKRGVQNINDFIASVPGVDLGGPSTPITSHVKIRGVTTAAGGESIQTTATYLDEFPMGVGALPIRLVDMSRVEVLKGPQGTLYGQSAMGGAIRYITNKPDMDEIEGGVNSYYSRTTHGGSNYGIQGYLNVPLSDTVAARGVFYNYDNDGFIDARNVWVGDLSGGRSGQTIDNSNTEDTFGGRLAVTWQATDNLTFDLLYLNEKVELGDTQWVNETYTPVTYGTPITDKQPVDFSDPTTRVVEPTRAHYKVLNLKLEAEFDAFNVSVLGAHKDINGRRFAGDFGTYVRLSLGALPVENLYDNAVDTLEMRLVSNYESGDFLSYVAGIWYEDGKEIATQEVVLFTGVGNPNFTGPDDLTIFGFSNGETTGNVYRERLSYELAFYGEVGAHFTENMVLTLGYRRANVSYSDDVLHPETCLGSACSLLGVDTKRAQNVNTYKANFEYTLNDDILLYALATSGYRRGGFSAGSLDGLLPPSEYKSDSLWNYEIGARTSWFDNKLIVNANLYRIDWTDMQLRKFVSPPGRTDIYTQLSNIGKSRLYGAELEINYRVMDYLTVGGSYGYVDAKAGVDLPAEGVVVGDRLPGSSKNSYSIFADWNSPISDAVDLTVYVSHSYQGDKLNVLGGKNVLITNFDIPSLSLTNARVGIEHINGVTVSLFADNIFNNVQAPYRVSTPLFGIHPINKPRTVGVNLGYKF